LVGCPFCEDKLAIGLTDSHFGVHEEFHGKNMDTIPHMDTFKWSLNEPSRWYKKQYAFLTFTLIWRSHASM